MPIFGLLIGFLVLGSFFGFFGFLLLGEPLFLFVAFGLFSKGMRKKWGGKPRVFLEREFLERVWRASVRCRLSTAHIGDWRSPGFQTRLPCLVCFVYLPALPRVHLPFWLQIPAWCLFWQATAVPTLGIRVGYRIRLPRLYPYVAVEYGSPASTIAFFIANSTRWYRVTGGLASIPLSVSLPGCPSWRSLTASFRGFTLGFAPESLYRVELFILDIYMPKTPPPGAISGRFRPRPRGIWLSPHPFAHAKLAGPNMLKIPANYFRVALIPMVCPSG